MITYSNREITLDRGTPSLLDIAVQLGRIPRWAGATRRFFPVLLHCFVVSDLLPDHLKVYGLLHDATELWFGDIPGPAKPKIVSKLEGIISTRIYRSLGIKPPTIAVRATIKVADLRSRTGEVHVIGAPGLRTHKSFLARDAEAESLVVFYADKYHDYREMVEERGAAVGDFVKRVRKELRRNAR